jgi:hypothetical protein
MPSVATSWRGAALNMKKGKIFVTGVEGRPDLKPEN